MLGPVDRDLGEVEADDPVIGGGCFDAEVLEHPGCGPLASASSQCRLARAADPPGHVPRAAGDEPAQDPFEADPVSDPVAVTAERVRVGDMHGDERLDCRPDGIDGPGMQREHDGGLHLVVGGWVAPGIKTGPTQRPVDGHHPPPIGARSKQQLCVTGTEPFIGGEADLWRKVLYDIGRASVPLTTGWARKDETNDHKDNETSQLHHNMLPDLKPVG